MRTLIRSRARNERGAVMIFVGVILIALMGFGALVIDVGALYQERRELQNGADAAALAVAQDCAGGDCKDEDTTADQYADDNATDEAANVDSVCGAGPGLPVCTDPPPGTAGFDNWVAVNTSTQDDDGSTDIDFVLAPILPDGMVSDTVEARAIAAWGPVGRATTIPLIFSTCEFFETFGGSIDPLIIPTGDPHYIYFHDTSDAGTCPRGPSGADLPGGFGWLETSGSCDVTVEVDGWIDDKPGNSVPNNCDPSAWQNAEVLLPLYDETNDLSGSNGEYHVAGFAGFRVLGYSFPGNVWANGFPCGPKPPGSTRYLCGEITEVPPTQGEIGSGSNYGATTITMIG